MTGILGYLVNRDGRNLFIRDLEEAAWAIDDPEYKVTQLVAYDDSLEVLLREVQEDRDLYMQICDLQDEEIQTLKRQLKELQK